VPLREELTRAATQRLLVVGTEEMERDSLNRVEHARMALGRMDPAQDGGRRIGLPADRALGLTDQRPGPAGDARIAVVRRLRRHAPLGDVRHRLYDGLDRGAPHLVAIEAALADLRHRERPGGPDVASIDLGRRLQYRHAPLAGAELDRPVE
jgi:hypothetical protein